ncbi:hypothetical protein PCASD_11823 [Puccinia coronata f. sp. avenae]|uniref:Uncharacterized protein n=1 Tax=Puccinia coronata f. sp. avenae TaxID=200324 RepID=A0A2N5UTN5_9BASI|nr:hypothetical protein PCASD_11823 [Puccinia coronata f. sp. avenae]
MAYLDYHTDIATRPGNNATCPGNTAGNNSNTSPHSGNITTGTANNPSSHTSVTRSGGTTLSCSGTAVTPGMTITPSGADVAVTNSTSRKRKSAPSGAAGANDAFKKRKSRKAPGAKEYKDVCRGNAITNRAYLSKVLGKMFLNAGGNSRGWPGKNTNTGLAEFKLKLVIKKNKIDIDSHLRNVPISRMKIKHT